ncbi:hypothetical protein [Psychroserpens algicola]|uniref:hypothetical protein n=1 Tax=Psychroserpens algicola TaxID=1719034 RepID=UPI0019547DAB|nr:hypothetical protein [Psychroserpens algicola]
MKNLVAIVLIALMLSSNFVVAQAVVGDPNQYEASWRLKQVIRDKLNVQERSNPIEFSDIKGSPYLNESFKDGQYFLNGKSQGHFYIRYNVYNDQIEILTDVSPENFNSKTPKYDAFLKSNNSKIILDGKTIKSYYYNDDNGNTTNSYFIEVNTTDKYTLLVRKRCVLTPAEKAATPNQADRAARFTIYDDYYMLDKNEQYPRKIEPKQRKLLKTFPAKADALKDYIKKERINLKEEDDLIKLTNYMSTI